MLKPRLIIKSFHCAYMTMTKRASALAALCLMMSIFQQCKHSTLILGVLLLFFSPLFALAFAWPNPSAAQQQQEPARASVVSLNRSRHRPIAHILSLRVPLQSQTTSQLQTRMTVRHTFLYAARVAASTVLCCTSSGALVQASGSDFAQNKMR